MLVIIYPFFYLLLTTLIYSLRSLYFSFVQVRWQTGHADSGRLHSGQYGCFCFAIFFFINLNLNLTILYSVEMGSWNWCAPPFKVYNFCKINAFFSQSQSLFFTNCRLNEVEVLPSLWTHQFNRWRVFHIYIKVRGSPDSWLAWTACCDAVPVVICTFVCVCVCMWSM